MTGLGVLEYIKLAIFYTSYLYFPAAVLCILVMEKRKGVLRYGAAVLLIVTSFLAYGRFVEPRILLTAEHDVELMRCFNDAGVVRIAVFSDTHNGLFANAMPVERIVTHVNEANADVALIPGDFIYFLHPDRFGETFSALTEIKAPVFAVLGNHDLGLPGPDLSGPLNSALPNYGVRMIDNQPLMISSGKFELELTGLSDQWGREQNLALLERRTNFPRIVLTHNPATVEDLSPSMSADLLIGGHTHGGQIQLPLLTCWLTGVCGDAGYGLREAPARLYSTTENGDGPPVGVRDAREMLIFTTSGTGMVGLPMRFRAPPRIDVLNVKYKVCGNGADAPTES